eukprot:TRINITY_DN10148_c0_g1_i1.p1 TRINITY_DN10148_c0_g1~~TRINITY_DN10148_c0_g1_i1.p1  ORF type:complete len:377 (-),score=64.99 TRINITY_DN10148_c0_g1_i1:91-1221(-)
MAQYCLNQRVLYRPLVTSLRSNPHYLLRTTTSLSPSLKSTIVFKSNFSTSTHNNANANKPQETFVAKVTSSMKEFIGSTVQLYRNYKKVHKFLIPRHTQGHSMLSREEFQLIRKTRKDVRSFVPFFIYFMLPFSFILLPVVVRFVPQLIPSIYLTKKDKHAILINLSKHTAESWVHVRTRIVKYLKYITEHPSKTRLTTEQINSLEYYNDNVKHLLETDQPLSQKDIEKIEPLFYGPLSLKRLAEGGDAERDILASLGRGHHVTGFFSPLSPLYAAYMPSIIVNSLNHKLDEILEDDILIYHYHTDLTGTPLEEACEERCIPFLNVPESDLQKILHKWVLFTVNAKKYPRDMLLFLPALDFLSVPDETALTEWKKN